MKMMDLRPGDERLVEQAADLLVDGFKDNAPAAWPDREAALREVRESLAEGRISRIAVDEAGNVLWGRLSSLLTPLFYLGGYPVMRRISSYSGRSRRYMCLYTRWYSPS